jgi:phage host-nuclease inhibitor protein Gam
MTETISEKLDRMAEFQAQKDLLAIDKQTLIDQVLTTEVKARLAEIETEFDGRAEAVDANIAALEAEIKEDVLKHGATVRGAYMMAVWNKGRVAWDDRSLSNYARSHPEVLEFRRQGEPSISIRKA